MCKMKISLNRIILYVQDVNRLKEFYQENLGLTPIEEITGEWTLLQAGVGELALHRVGKPYRVKDPESWRVQSNGKLVFTVDRDIEELRQELLEKGVPMREVKSYPGFPYMLCDGEDPEGNIFQLSKDVPRS